MRGQGRRKRVAYETHWMKLASKKKCWINIYGMIKGKGVHNKGSRAGQYSCNTMMETLTSLPSKLFKNPNP